MKKLRYIILILILLLLVCLCFFKCKEVKALNTEEDTIILNISDSSQSDYNCVMIYGMSYDSSNIEGNLLKIGDTNREYIRFTYTSDTSYTLLILDKNGNALESINPVSDFLQIQVVEDTNYLYLIIYSLSFDLQHNQGTAPIINGINRTMICRHQLNTFLYDAWASPYGLDVYTLYPNQNFAGLINCSYIGYSDSVSDINNWVDKQLLFNRTLNSILYSSYLYGSNDGYNDGYAVGLDEGEDIGHSNGYDEGLIDGEAIGYDNGYNFGLDVGYYNGYADGEAGNNAVHPLWAMIRDIAVGIGDILAIQLGPGITIGTIVFVPLFFSALGLILWIWRRN